MKQRRARAILAAWGDLGPEARRTSLAGLPPDLAVAIEQSWWALEGQREPPGDWRIWSIVAGRGFGKTRAGAEWVWAKARQGGSSGPSDLRIALVGASLDEVARVMVEGESGLLAAARVGEAPRWISSRGLFLFPSGAKAFAYTAERPAMLRGPQHHFAWCDELAKWPNADSTWDNLMLGLRLGERPRTLVTTTPQPVPLLKRILALPRSVATSGRTADNPHLPADFKEAVEAMYAGTRLGRQELDGQLLEDLPGALWTRDMIEKARLKEGLTQRRGDAESHDPFTGRAAATPAEARNLVASPPDGQRHGVSAPLRLCVRPLDLVRIVIGVDPPAGTSGDSCGIVVCGLGRDGRAYVLADHSVAGLRPEGWAGRVAAAFEAWGAQKIVAEQNQGGAMVASVLHAADPGLPVKLVTARAGKAARAEPIALRFETGQALLAGTFPDLEDELCGLTYAGYEGPTASPDRADAMVWAMTDLFETPRAEPRVRRL